MIDLIQHHYCKTNGELIFSEPLFSTYDSIGALVSSTFQRGSLRSAGLAPPNSHPSGTAAAGPGRKPKVNSERRFAMKKPQEMSPGYQLALRGTRCSINQLLHNLQSESDPVRNKALSATMIFRMWRLVRYARQVG